MLSTEFFLVSLPLSPHIIIILSSLQLCSTCPKCLSTLTIILYTYVTWITRILRLWENVQRSKINFIIHIYIICIGILVILLYYYSPVRHCRSRITMPLPRPIHGYEFNVIKLSRETFDARYNNIIGTCLNYAL